ncbi:MAG: hypothetical protein ACREIF_06510 [Chthoniobacterales bacterium]
MITFLVAGTTLAADGTWIADPVDNNWNNPANWSSGTVPGYYDVAFFDGSAVKEINDTQATSLEVIVFNPGADAFTISALPGAGISSRLGVQNNSGMEQNFVATADGQGNSGGFTITQSIDPATITGPVTFTEQARNSPTGFAPGVTFFFAGAGDATFHNLGASIAGGVGGRTDFVATGASAENCMVINDGGTVSGATGGETDFSQGKPSAGNATFIANGGSGGGGFITFEGGSLGGT